MRRSAADQTQLQVQGGEPAGMPAQAQVPGRALNSACMPPGVPPHLLAQQLQKCCMHTRPAAARPMKQAYLVFCRSSCPVMFKYNSTHAGCSRPPVASVCRVYYGEGVPEDVLGILRAFSAELIRIDTKQVGDCAVVMTMLRSMAEPVSQPVLRCVATLSLGCCIWSYALR